eukprot:TRINITY_DN15392_c0_g1_i1.p2 TRINITY_DN15392_c0_g1~~TRINITY_DN15392_c0_g1_i1.p2  ORF type:complete len:175 (+),score=7.95 TRINITY_DN15392_c0_g1_i1:783-1307(+)
MAGEVLLAHAVGRQDGLIDLRRFFLHPGQECGAEVEADLCVVVRQFYDVAFIVQDAGNGVRRVAFGQNPFIPVMVGISGILNFNGFEPRVFPWRLVKVAVNADVSLHQTSSRLTKNTKECGAKERVVSALPKMVEGTLLPGPAHLSRAESNIVSHVLCVDTCLLYTSPSPRDQA